MEQDNTTTGSAGPTTMTRPREGRMIAGVAEALSRRLAIPAWIIRLVFIATLFAGGLGLVAYLVCWALMPQEGETETPASRILFGNMTAQGWIGIGLVFIAAIILLDNFTFLSRGMIWAGALLVIGVLLYAGQLQLPGSTPPSGGDGSSASKEGVQRMSGTDDTIHGDEGVSPSPSLTQALAFSEPPAPPTPPRPVAPRPPRDRSILGRLTVAMTFLALGVLGALAILPDVDVNPQFRHYLALATVVVGVGLLVGSVWGRARWLILIGAVLVPTLLITPLAGYGWSGRQFYANPQSFSEVQDSYRVDVGEIVINLTDLPWNGQEISIDVRAEVGRIWIYLPVDVASNGEARTEVGSINVPGQPRQGWGVGTRTVGFDYAPDGARGAVSILASVEVGAIRIFPSGSSSATTTTTFGN